MRPPLAINNDAPKQEKVERVLLLSKNYQKLAGTD